MSAKTLTYVVGSFAAGQFQPIATMTLVAPWNNAMFREIDNHTRQRLKVLIASPETKPDPKKFQMEGKQWLA